MARVDTRSATPAGTPAPAGRLSDEARALAEEHLPLVRSVLAGVAAHYPRHADRDELAGAAALGLVEAAARYDPAQSVPFARWAAVRVRGAVLDAVRALDPAPRSVRRAAREVGSAQAALETSLGRPAGLAEVAAALGVAVADVAALQSRVHRSLVLSLDAPSGTGGASSPLGAGLLDLAQPQPPELLEQREQSRYLADALACLPEPVRQVVQGYFLAGRTSAELAAELGVTESRVSQLRTQGLRLLRAGLEAQYVEVPRPAAPASDAAGQRVGAYAAAVAARSSYAARLAPVRDPAARAV